MMALLFCVWILFTRRDTSLNEKDDHTERRHSGEYKVPKRGSQQCYEKRSFVYIKMIKCASETLASMFRRFGYVRDLDFMLPVDQRMYIGWPYRIEKDFYRPSLTGRFNIMCDHAIFDANVFRGVMAEDSLYITSIREPFAQFKSMFHYYNLHKIINMEETSDPIGLYLKEIEKYEAIYKSHEAAKLRFCIPDGLSMSKNLMSFNLGYKTGSMNGTSNRSDNTTEVGSWLKQLDRQFDLVMIVEYMVESLVLLKRMMCWSIRDILHVAQNVGDYSYKAKHDNLDTVNRYKQWSHLDHKLYQHFNRTFWQKVQNEGSDFLEEVKHVRKTLTTVSNFCNNKEGRAKIYHFPATKWDGAFNVTSQGCALMSKGLLKEVKQVYDNRKPSSINLPQPSKYFC